MVEPIKSWIKENSALVYFLIGQMIVLGTGGASILAYMVKLETRVAIMETRGAEYTAIRLGKIDEKITVLEQRTQADHDQLQRLVNEYLKERNK